MSGTIVGNFDQESHRVAFVGSAVATGKRLDCYQVRDVFATDGFREIIAGGCWIGLITFGRSCRVGDRVATLADINRTFKRQRRGFANVQRADIEDARTRIVTSL